MLARIYAFVNANTMPEGSCGGIISARRLGSCGRVRYRVEQHFWHRVGHQIHKRELQAGRKARKRSVVEDRMLQIDARTAR
jgi:hypothetical protein